MSAHLLSCYSHCFAPPLSPDQGQTKKKDETTSYEDMTWQGSAGQGRTGQDRTGQGRAGQDRSGQVRSGQVRSGQIRSGQGRSSKAFHFRQQTSAVLSTERLTMKYLLLLLHPGWSFPIPLHLVSGQVWRNNDESFPEQWEADPHSTLNIYGMRKHESLVF